MLVRDAGAVGRHMRAREALAEVCMVVTVRDEVREGRQLNRKHEQREHELRGGESELGESHAAVRHADAKR